MIIGYIKIILTNMLFLVIKYVMGLYDHKKNTYPYYKLK
jgi:hypothetical protein